METLVLAVVVASQAVLARAAPTDQVAHQAPVHQDLGHQAPLTPPHQISLETLPAVPPHSGELFWPSHNKLWKKFPKKKHLVEIVPLEQSLVKGKGKKLAYILPNSNLNTQTNLVFDSSEENNKESDSDESVIINKKKPKDDSDEIITNKINELVQYFKNKNKVAAVKDSTHRDDNYHVHYIVHKKRNKNEDNESDEKLQKIVPTDAIPDLHQHDQNEAHYINNQDNGNNEYNVHHHTLHNNHQVQTISNDNTVNIHHTHAKHVAINSPEIRDISYEKHTKHDHYNSIERANLNKDNTVEYKDNEHDTIHEYWVSGENPQELSNDQKTTESLDSMNYLDDTKPVENSENDDTSSEEYRNDDIWDDNKTTQNLDNSKTTELLDDLKWAEYINDGNIQEFSSNDESAEYLSDVQNLSYPDYDDNTSDNLSYERTSEYSDDDKTSEEIISSKPLTHQNNRKEVLSPAVYLSSVPEYSLDDDDDDNGDLHFLKDDNIEILPNVKELIQELSQLIEPREKTRIIDTKEVIDLGERADIHHHHHHNHKQSVPNVQGIIQNDDSIAPFMITEADDENQNDNIPNQEKQMDDVLKDVHGIDIAIIGNESELDDKYEQSELNEVNNKLSDESTDKEYLQNREGVTDKVSELVDLSSLMSHKIKVNADCPNKNKESTCAHKSYKLTFFFNR